MLGWRLAPPACSRGEEWNVTWAGRPAEDRDSLPVRDTITRSSARGPTGLENQAPGPESGPALFLLPCAASRIFRRGAPSSARWVRLPRPGGGRSRASVKAAGASPPPPVAPGSSQRSGSRPQWLPLGGENEEGGLERQQERLRLAPGKPIDTPLRRRPGPCLIRTVDSLIRYSRFIRDGHRVCPSRELDYPARRAIKRAGGGWLELGN